MSAPKPSRDPERNRIVRERVRAVLDDDEYVHGVAGALEAVAEHAWMRAIDVDRFTELARDAYERFIAGRAGDTPPAEAGWEELPPPFSERGGASRPGSGDGSAA